LVPSSAIVFCLDLELRRTCAGFVPPTNSRRCPPLLAYFFFCGSLISGRRHFDSGASCRVSPIVVSCLNPECLGLLWILSSPPPIKVPSNLFPPFPNCKLPFGMVREPCLCVAGRRFSSLPIGLSSSLFSIRSYFLFLRPAAFPHCRARVLSRLLAFSFPSFILSRSRKSLTS